MEDSSTDLISSSTLPGSGDPEQPSLKRRTSSMMTQGGGDPWDSLGRIKKPRLDHADSYSSCLLSASGEINGDVSNGNNVANGLHATDEEATLSYEFEETDLEKGKNKSKDSFSFYQDTQTLKQTDFKCRDGVDEDVIPEWESEGRLSPTLRQGLDFHDVNGENDSAKREETVEELSPTLETSFDVVDSPDSPDWLQDGYYERKIHEHASQREALDSLGAEVSAFDKTLPYDADSLTQGEKHEETVDGGQQTKNSGENGIVCDRETKVLQVAEELSQNDVTRSYHHGDVAAKTSADSSVTAINPSVTSEGTVIETTDENNKDNIKSDTNESDEHSSTTHQIPSISPLQNNTAVVNLTDTTPIVAGKGLPGSPSPDKMIVISDEGTPESVHAGPTQGNVEVAIKHRDILALSSTGESAGSCRLENGENHKQAVIVSSCSTSRMDNSVHTTVPALIQKDSIEQDANTIANIIGEVDIEKVLKRLRQKRTDPHRVDVVLNEVLEGQLQSEINKAEAEVIEHVQRGRGGADDPLMEDVQEVVRQVPGVDPNRVFYLLLESTSHPRDRVKALVAQLRGRPGAPTAEDVIVISDDPTPKPPPLRSSLSDPTDPIVVGDELYADTRTIARIFPNRDRNEIYAYLEAHHDRPDRVQRVMDELLAIGTESQTPPVTQEIEVTGDQSVTDSTTPARAQPTNPQADLQRDVEHLCMVFPDCDPNYVYTRLEQTKDLPNRTQMLAAQMFEFKTYPKLKDMQEKNSKEALKRKLINMTLNMTEFLTMFPDPVDVFLNEDKAVSETYKEHAVTQLVNCFPALKEPFIKKILEKRKNHFTPALRELEKEAVKYTDRHKNSSKYLKQPRLIERDFPEQPDEFFFKELLFSRHEEEIKAHIEEQRRLRTIMVEEAKRDGSLMECGCCFDDECLFEDMAACTDGHLYCKECIRRSSEVRIGENKFDFPCLMDSCGHKFPVQTLQSVLPHNVFSNVLRKMQEEEIRQADIPDLVSCPFCSFATIMPDPNDKVFKCLNPQCLKESCRLCKEPNHVPLRCEEVEKGKETSMRTFIEDRITEAMLRTCWKCKKKFFKLDGCNKMTCTCGATMCYVCRAPDIDYGHFNQQNGCAAHTDMNELHRQEMEKAAAEAKTKYQQENPEAAGLHLKNDPMKLIEQMRQEREREQVQRALNPFEMPVGLNPAGIPGVMYMHNWLLDVDVNGEDSR